TLVINFAHTGRASDIDLGDVVTNDIKANEHQAFLADHRLHLLDQPVITICEFAADTCATGSQVATRFTSGGDACQTKGYRFAIYQQDTCITVLDLRKITLRHDLTLATLGQCFDDSPQVATIGADMEDATATHTIQR